MLCFSMIRYALTADKKDCSENEGFISCAQKSVANIEASANWRYIFQTKRQKCVNLPTYEHSDGQLENNKETVDFFYKRTFLQSSAKNLCNVAIFAI